MDKLNSIGMANGRSSLRPFIILFVGSLVLYFIVGPPTSLGSSSSTRTTVVEDEDSEHIVLLKEKILHLESLVNRLEKSVDVISNQRVSNIRTRERQSKESSSRPLKTNTIVEKLWVSSSLSSESSSTLWSSLDFVDEKGSDHVEQINNDQLVYSCLDDDGDSDVLQNELSLFGKPIYAKNKTIMYVTMPKCGSRTFVWTVFRLQIDHHFGTPVGLPYMLADEPPVKMRKYFDLALRQVQDGALIHGHYRYIDMNSSLKSPVMISIIRDPVERLVSKFYFMRHGDMDMDKEELLEKIRRRRNGALPNETIDDCVQKGKGECTSSLFRNFYITSFCGYDPKCSKYPDYALKQAKLNVDKFLVIGLVEEYDLSMAVFEKLLPETFGGAAKIYAENKDQSMEKSKTSYKLPPSPMTYSILKQNLKKDYEFYDYVKKRLHKVAKNLGIGYCDVHCR
nr:uronyl 2-sulfotransferase-like [Lytechinus pictus]